MRSYEHLYRRMDELRALSKEEMEDDPLGSSPMSEVSVIRFFTFCDQLKDVDFCVALHPNGTIIAQKKFGETWENRLVLSFKEDGSVIMVNRDPGGPKPGRTMTCTSIQEAVDILRLDRPQLFI